jgi:hypothetical protein
MGKTKSSKGADILWRFIISAVGMALILIAVFSLLLYFFGITTAASVTTRRVGGSDDGRPTNQRYLWSLDYTFTDAEGVLNDGHTSRRGSDMSVKTDARVYYFPFAPFINTLESEAKPGLAQPLYVVLGVFLIAVINRKRKSSQQKTIKNPSELTDYDDSVEAQYHHDN